MIFTVKRRLKLFSLENITSSDVIFMRTARVPFSSPESTIQLTCGRSKGSWALARDENACVLEACVVARMCGRELSKFLFVKMNK